MRRALTGTNHNTNNNNNNHDNDNDDRMWSCCSHFRVEVTTLPLSGNFPNKKAFQ